MFPDPEKLNKGAKKVRQHKIGSEQSARERFGRQNLSQKVPSNKGSLGVIFCPRSYRGNAHSKSANFEGRHSGGHLLGRPLLFTSNKKPERAYKKRNDGPPKTGTRAHSPKPPFYKTALLFPLERIETSPAPYRPLYKFQSSWEWQKGQKMPRAKKCQNPIHFCHIVAYSWPILGSAVDSV